MSIAENLCLVRSRIEKACHKSGRDPGAVQLCAVSKFHPAEAVLEAYAAGQRLFGENYAQELRDKASQLSHLADLEFHFIGQLQRNKTKYVASVAHTWESLDDLEVAQELSRRLAALNRTIDALVEVNFDEAQKGGVPLQRVPSFLDEVRQSAPNLQITGLMAIPPADISQEETRQIFRHLAAKAKVLGLKELSMGMSHDFEIAVEEGSTLVRVGTAIFGPRPSRIAN